MTKVQLAELVRDNSHNLDLSNAKDKEVFDSLTKQFLIQLEGYSLWAYDDARPSKGKANLIKNILAKGEKVLGNVTVGIGCNMDAGGGKGSKGFRGEWQKIVQTDFDDVYVGNACITDEDVDKLLKHHIDDAIEKLKDIYDGVWDAFRPNEKMAIIVAYFNCNGVVGNNTNFQRYMTGYAKTGDKGYLLKAVEELRARSNKDKLPGIAIRREAEAALLNSTECPFYIFGNEKHFPDLRDSVYAEKTRIPSSATKGKLASDSDEFFVWRTKLDGKVRESHLIREGLIFRRDRAGMDMPGEAFGCRCWKEALPKHFSVREHKAMFFHLRYSASSCCFDAQC